MGILYITKEERDEARRFFVAYILRTDHVPLFFDWSQRPGGPSKADGPGEPIIPQGKTRCDWHGHAIDPMTKTCERCGITRVEADAFGDPVQQQTAPGSPWPKQGQHHADAMHHLFERINERTKKAYAKGSKPFNLCPNLQRDLEEITRDIPRCTSCSGSLMQRKAVGPAHVLRNVWECPVCHSELEDVEAVEVVPEPPKQLPPHGDGV